MSSLEAFGLIAGVASIIGLVLAVYYARRSGERRKLLAFENQRLNLPLVSAPSFQDHGIKIVYSGPEGADEAIDSAYVSYLRFANFGREPIRRSDIAEGDPLRIEVIGARTLSIRLEATTRQVTDVRLSEMGAGPGASTIALLNFEFLDYLDGGLVQIMTTERPKDILLAGVVVGMPDGVRHSHELRRMPLLRKLGALGAVLFELSALLLTPFVFRWVTGSWDDVWLLLLPPLAFFLPILIIILVNTTIWPKQGLAFPHPLALPAWAVRRVMMLEHSAPFDGEDAFSELEPKGIGLSLGRSQPEPSNRSRTKAQTDGPLD